jgi:exodeoxyribonuclease V beta subunit
MTAPRVLGDVTFDRSFVIEASAGTGKTYTLEHLVLDLLLTTDATLDHILVVTFTEKATQELRARIRQTLQSYDAGGDEAAATKIDRAVRGFDAATITTIHAFCLRVLRENAFGSGRLFDERQVDGRGTFARAFREALRCEVAPDPVRSVWLEAALRSGWTMKRMEDLLWRCASARAELRPTFDPAALDAAIEAMPPVSPADKDLLTALKSWGIHTNTVRALGRRLFEVAAAAERAREDDDAAQYVLDADAKGWSKLLDDRDRLVGRPGRAGALFAAADRLVSATPPFHAALAAALFPPTVGAWMRGKRDAGAYDFDDMLALVDGALRGPGGGAFGTSLRRRWRYALIDEFQDTDETQWSIFRRAFFHGSNPRSVVFLVGDPKQSIYRFRGADVEAYLGARDEVVASGGHRVPLERNFRATRDLVEATNVVFDPSAAEPIFDGDIRYSPVTCGRPERALTDADGRAVTPVHVLRLKDERNLEALGGAIAGAILTMTDPVRPWRFDGRPLEPSDVFVLTRTTREGRRIGSALRAAGVPHAFYKEEGLFQTDEAKDLRTLFSAIDHPEDRACRLAAWLTPFFGVPLAMLEGVRDLSTGHPLVTRLAAWKTIADARDFERLFESIVRDSGIVRREIFFADTEREVTNTLHLLELLLQRAREGQPTLADLTNELAGQIAQTRLPSKFEENVQRLESERRATQIMTIHKSKGLEAPVVFVAGGTSQPPADEVRVYHDEGSRKVWVGKASGEVEARVKREEQGEDQRLMYVALTRAMGRVFLPLVVDDAGKARRLRGPYARMNRRVAELVEARSPLLSVDDVANDAVEGAAPGEAARAWQPPEALLHDRDRSGAFDAARAAHSGAVVTSYTRLTAERARGRGARVEAHSADDAASDRLEREPGLRSARSSGVFLHELLERVALASFAEHPVFDEWRKRPDVAELFDETMAVHRVAPEEQEHAERMVWAAYTTPVSLHGGRLEGIARAPRVAREMPFVYPVSDGGRVLVRGSLDVAFEHEGRTHFVDWKSDTLPSYGAAALERRVGEHYDAQRKLYALAIAKLLGIASEADHEARFGGILYCFLRGFGPEGQGLWAERPSWRELMAWAEDVRTWGRTP